MGGVVGVGPRTQIYSLKFATGPEDKEALEWATAINYAVDVLGVRIISMSVGLYGDYQVLHTACDYAYTHGVLLVTASGNDNEYSMNYPAAYSTVVAVGAVDKNDQRWVNPPTGGGSNYGPKLELAAPGADINSTWLMAYGGYREDNGTSMAVAHVTAASALIWTSKIDPAFDTNHDGLWENYEVRAKLANWTLDLGSTGRDDYYGYGLVNGWTPNQRPVGDINNDFDCELRDVYAVAKAYGSYPGHPRWDPRTDIDINNLVDAKDYYTVCRHYGERDP
jgi:hypothetical protein